ncbi:uncharacterized protein V6R79_021580 [Siganus canaliculatus]
MQDYIWRCRIHHGVRLQKGPVPFPESVKIGLDFNAASEREEKLDPCLLTNAVMLELCHFSRTVTRSEIFCLFEMLEFNFDLGLDLDDDRQWYEFAKRVYLRIKLLKKQIKIKSRRWTEAFPLPDANSVTGQSGPDGSGQYIPKWNRNVDCSVLSESTKTRQTSDSQETGSDEAAKVDCPVKKRGVEVMADAYPFCKRVGVVLAVRPFDAPMQKMDPNTVSNGVMLELLHFSSVLCGKYMGMIVELIRQNFGLELDQTRFRLFLSKLVKRRNSCLTAEDKHRFRTETCALPLKGQVHRKKRKRKNSDCDEPKRLMADRSRDDVRSQGSEELFQDGDLSYTCPLECDVEMLPSSEAGSSSGRSEATSLDVKLEEDLVSAPPLSVRPRTQTLDAVSGLFSDDGGGGGGVDMSGKTQQQKLWMRRAPRSKQILNSGRVNDIYRRSRGAGLDFNVGSGNKQNLDTQLLTNAVLLEIHKFGTAMSKSLFSFTIEILQNNFTLVLQDDLHRRNFLYYIMTKEKNLQHHADRLKPEFLCRPFNFPGVYRMVGVNGELQPGQEAEADTPPPPPSLADPDQHPFCAQVGVDLWLTEPRPASRKLDLSVLTVGAVFEIFAFVRQLCASARETVNDVLEHNFAVELRSGTTVAAQMIQRWYAMQRAVTRRQSSVTKLNRWLGKVVPLDGVPPRTPRTPKKKVCGPSWSGGGSKVKTETPSVAEETTQEARSYDVCQKLGLDLDVGSKPGTKPKLDVQVLTRGALFEMHRYVSQNCSRYVPALYDILDYNFDLSSQQHRKVEFAWSVAAQVIAIAGKTGRTGGYMNRAVELPFEVPGDAEVVCKDEPQDGAGERDVNDEADLEFVRELKPVDIEVEVE